MQVYLRRLAQALRLDANVMEHQREAYLDCGMDGVVGKPIAPALLLSEIMRLATAAPDAAPVSQAGSSAA